MALYAIFGTVATADLDARVTQAFPEHYPIAPGQWVISYPASLPNDVYQTMKNLGGDIRCIVSSLTYYYGWHDQALWVWMEAHRGP